MATPAGGVDAATAARSEGPDKYEHKTRMRDSRMTVTKTMEEVRACVCVCAFRRAHACVGGRR
jgi:hypothetical protein